MNKVTIDMAAKATGRFDIHRFKQRTRKERERAWHAFRALGVGGSDMSTILGLNPYATPFRLWLEKTNRQTPEDISDKWAIVKGNALEGELRKRFRRLHPEWVVRDGTDISLVSREHPLMHASLDGFIYDEATDSWGILEIKTANANRGRTDWHDEATGELKAPDYYMAQVTHYMAVTGFQWGYFYADIGETEPVEIRFERDEDDIGAVVRAAEEFWGFVTRDEMPRLKAVDVVKAYPEPTEGVEVADDDDDLAGLMREYEHARQAADAAADDVKLLQEALIVRIGDHAGVRCRGFEATYKPFHRKGYVREVKPSSGRTFRFKQLKERN
ncbi:phage-type endonuclease family protein [Bifidobacterium saguini DSM 23967]|uniref:Phage-type endonuclease family protein n=2 Tax=Bifidobacterium saguini TaxID=762210 RepID=A0A087DAB7_9BIFI|nr:YqaJ viral recombinase family protein [Bifidobacterium saguini]KFI92467.1 phage-type endonuclease family protein [Bifidobacterium saguini DSM 23967]QTB90808.1 YqaJ viral recombinase family protein [Bifidobacterium saguini]QTB90870.1 YqaJ viral recombinase family protein [Bifidobacterium saguini]